jgi:putative SOS response-associated peptidase YedK
LSFNATWNIAPGTYNPVVTQGLSNEVKLMKWGLVPYWAKDPKIGYKMANARSEEIDKKPSFRRPLKQTRCIIPTDGFYEWRTVNLEGKNEKQPWYFGLTSTKLFSFAGLYDIWLDAEKRPLYTYTIITTEPNNLVQTVHTRMPVILEKKDESLWLNPETNIQDILKLLKPYPSDKMTSYPISLRVNSTENDSPDLVTPI